MDDSHDAPRVAANDAAAGEEPDELPIDPEIEALLEFEPVPRKVRRPDGWTPARQREFVHRLALSGAPGTAARQMRKNVSGIEALYREEGADSFRAAWDAALELAWARERRQRGTGFDGRAPGVKVRGSPSAQYEQWDEGENEDEEDLARRGEEAMDNIRRKLLRIRRLYLAEISASPPKRAAFEILTQLPIDWDKARRGEAQADEPYHVCNQRQPDMVLTAESGWSWGELGYGPDKKAEQRRAIDAWRAERGEEPVDWDGESAGLSENEGDEEGWEE